MKRFYFLILFLSLNTAIWTQTNYSENLWLAVAINGKLTETISYTGDFGFRTYDDFLKEKRTVLARFLVEKTSNKNHKFGLGYAFFEHFSADGSLNPEQRPFVQYRFKIQKNDFQFQTRFRNEFRFFTSREEFYNRSRVQINLQYNLFHQKFNPVFSAEGFISTGKNKLKESRFTFGFTNKLSSKLTSYFFYTIQNQSSYKGNQNIIGLQLQINLNENANTK